MSGAPLAAGASLVTSNLPFAAREASRGADGHVVDLATWASNGVESVSGLAFDVLVGQVLRGEYGLLCGPGMLHLLRFMFNSMLVILLDV